MFIQLFSIVAYPAIDSWYSSSQNNSNINEGNIPPPRPLLFLCPIVLQPDAMSKSSHFKMKKMGVHRSGPYCFFCKHCTVEYWFSLSNLIFFSKNEKEP